MLIYVDTSIYQRLLCSIIASTYSIGRTIAFPTFKSGGFGSSELQNHLGYYATVESPFDSFSSSNFFLSAAFVTSCSFFLAMISGNSGCCKAFVAAT